MKIVCDSCATKYSISDDKVRGKVFKIRCKKCSHIIVVRGTNDAMTPAAATPSALVQDGWHLVIDGDQVGPLPEADIRGRLSRGEINAETYIWKDGFADWLKLSAVPEFAGDLATASASGTPGAVASGDLFSEGQSGIAAESGAVRQPASAGRSGGLFAGIDAADAALAHGASGEEDAFSPPVSAPSRGGGADLFSAHAAPRPADDGGWGSGGGGMAGHDGGRVENLTAQRHENSVLFSLANLQSLAMPNSSGGGGGGAKPAASSSTSAPGSEGSGLIDIRAMAATTLGSSSSDSRGFGDDLPAFGAFSPAAPMLLEIPSGSGPSKWIYPAIGILIVLVGSIVVLAYNILTTKPAPIAEIPATPVIAPAPAAPGGALAKSAAPAPPVAPSAAGEKPAIPDDKLPPREAPPAAQAKADKPAIPGARRPTGRGGKERKVAAADTDKRPGGASAGAIPAVAAEPAADKKAAKGSLDDLLESALNGKPKGGAPKPRVEDDSSSRRAATPDPAGGGGPLTKAAVVGGMNGVKPKISECYNQFKVPGMAMVNVVIGKNGKVSTATVTGKFAGTPTGSCVERAVKSANFPPSDGLTTPYPFTLK